MSVIVIQQKVLAYQCKTLLEQENALKEVMQEIALMALSRAGFFRIAAFQGGTCLRILYGLERFSEDLDFILNEPNKNFDWSEYVLHMREEFNAYGFELDVQDRNKLDSTIKTAFLKADSQGGMLVLRDNRTHKPKLKIKLEIDTNPPHGSKYDLKYLDFPLPYSVKTQDLPSLFSGKCHALLCRPYTKGRDWYDFVWYVSRQVKINFFLLEQSLIQFGPWKGTQIRLDKDWFLKELKGKIEKQDWDSAKQDVSRFLREKENASLAVWSKEFFLSRVEKLSSYL